MLYRGPGYTDEQIEQTLVRARYNRFRKSGNVACDAAQLLADGKVLGWLQDAWRRPRALGRSILRTPPRGNEGRRQQAGQGPRALAPLRPSFLEEDAADYVTSPYPSPS